MPPREKQVDVLLGKLTRFGNATKVPEWDNSDYDTVFVFTIDWNEKRSPKFEVLSQDLGPIEETCPPH